MVVPDPTNARLYFQFTKGLGAAMPVPDREWLKQLRARIPASLGVNERDFQDLRDGMEFTGRRVLPDQMATDLPATARDIRTAFFVIQGRDDITTPAPSLGAR